MTVIVTQALRTQEPIIQNLMQLYTHDFSKFWAETSKGDLLPDGRFDAYPLEEYWSRPNWSATLIWRNDILAGFALINDHAHSGKPTDRNVGEFFVLRKHRGHGVGRLAAQILFAQHPGSWEIAVARKSVRAAQFWQKTIEGAAEVTDIHKLDLTNDDWNGPIFRFEWRTQ